MDLDDVDRSKGSDWDSLRGIWRGIYKRCDNPSAKDYAHYGARGIRMCEEWYDFEVFYEWAMTHGYRKGLTIDRVNNNQGYRPGNCRWVTRKAQANNRTTARMYTIDGHTKSLTQWCRHYGIPTYVACHRMNDYGWSVKDALTTPVGEKRRQERTRPFGQLQFGG